jgi:glycosyltransferase involved in cell wall biosynthesis
MHEVTRDTSLLRAPGRIIYRYLASCCDGIIVHTNTAFNVLTDSIGISKAIVAVIPHPTEHLPAATAMADDIRTHFDLANSTIFVAFGFVHVDKGLDDLIDALSLLRRREPGSLHNIRLVIAGDVRPRSGLFRYFEFRDRLYLARIIQMIRRAKLQGYIIRTGYVPAGDVAGWFRVADALILPYRRTDQSGVSGLAIASGVPVLASTVGGLREQFADSRWTFPPRNPESLARVLIDFLAMSPTQRVEAARLPRIVDINAVVEATHDVYLAAINNMNIAS